MPDLTLDENYQIILEFDEQTQTVRHCQVQEMIDGQVYYLLQPGNDNKLSIGVCRKVEAESWKETCPQIGVIRGNFTYTVLFISNCYPSLIDENRIWTEDYSLISLSNDTESQSALYYDKRKITREQFISVAQNPTHSLAPALLKQMLANIKYLREDVQINRQLERLYSNVRTEQGLNDWHKFRTLCNSYGETKDKKSRTELIYLVANMQAAHNAHEFLIEKLQEYRAKREQRIDEYYTFWARFFGGQARSRTAKLNAVDSLVSTLKTKQGALSASDIPDAATNGELKEIIDTYCEAMRP